MLNAAACYSMGLARRAGEDCASAGLAASSVCRRLGGSRPLIMDMSGDVKDVAVRCVVLDWVAAPGICCLSKV